ncbi:hypothetical protein [Anabaena sp. CS-542/02]|uniref:hypothetical protein n=1 Tax=Anabaena sp. CS-542/02 TaxID=3021719 RepID=UPI00232E4863|nr:hypothetical protein [Anabaena sp. CS-542/02]
MIDVIASSLVAVIHLTYYLRLWLRHSRYHTARLVTKYQKSRPDERNFRIDPTYLLLFYENCTENLSFFTTLVGKLASQSWLEFGAAIALGYFQVKVSP